MIVLDLIAQHQHYRDHLIPVWRALPQEMRRHDWGEGLRMQPPPDRTLFVAGFSDVQRNPRNKYVYIEHGAGQSYDWTTATGSVADGFYSGGPGHNRCLAFLVPHQEAADRWLARYPDKPTFVVGSPRLDPWHAGLRGQVEPATVAVTFHYDAQFSGVPETASAFGNYFQDLLDIVIRWRRDGWHVIGHNHPRYPAVADFWQTPEMKDAGVEFVADSTLVLDRAAVLVADNTTLQADFLSLGRPVVWLNHPAYRRDVVHGGRFWTWPERSGIQVDTPRDLARLDLSSLSPPTWHPYAYADGRCAERAADCIASL